MNPTPHQHTLTVELIKSKAAYRRVLARLAAFFDHPPVARSSDEAAFQLLMMMVEQYEREHFPVPPPDPVSAIEFALEQRGLTKQDLLPILGSRQRVHDILKRKRRPSLAHVRELHEKFSIPAEVLIAAY
jgi:HTH-type transcriptional regulator / antitoxin HigA